MQNSGNHNIFPKIHCSYKNWFCTVNSALTYPNSLQTLLPRHRGSRWLTWCAVDCTGIVRMFRVKSLCMSKLELNWFKSNICRQRFMLYYISTWNRGVKTIQNIFSRRQQIRTTMWPYAHLEIKNNLLTGPSIYFVPVLHSQSLSSRQ